MKKIEEALTIYHKFKEAKVQDNHMDGFEKVFRDLLPEKYELRKNLAIQETPQRKKRWDYSVWENSKLKGVIELKSLGKSADKNINNRQEEAVGCAMLMKAGQPSVKRSYFLIGDALKEGTKERFKTFFQLCIEEVFYHSVGSLLLDATGNYTSFERFSVNDMFDIYKE